jgi:hypothetical protein
VNTDERALAAALRQLSADAPPIRVPTDLWVRGRRRRRLRLVAVVAGVAALVALVAVPLVWVPRPWAPRPWAPRPDPATPAVNARSIPSRVLPPVPLQPNAVDAPDGPASVILTGPGGFGASDVSGYDDRAIAVGRDGRYRYVRDVNSVNAGEDLLLSPDGRYVVGRADLEGVDLSVTDWQSTVGVMDLVTGRVRTYREGAAVAWSPDDRLLVRARSGLLRLVDVESGDVVPLGVAGGAVAFSPDGHQLALQQVRDLVVFDLATFAVREVAQLDGRQRLGGPGAWSPGGRLAIWASTDCQPACPSGYSDFQLSFVDIASGAVTGAGLDAVRAVSPSLLGWQSGGDAVVVLAMTSADPAGPRGAAPQVLALHPGGGQTSLIRVPADVDRIDVARDLLDHFGGAPSSGWDRLLDMLRVRLPQALPLIAIIATLVAAVVAYRRVRHGSWPRLLRVFGERGAARRGAAMNTTSKPSV